MGDNSIVSNERFLALTLRLSRLSLGCGRDSGGWHFPASSHEGLYAGDLFTDSLDTILVVGVRAHHFTLITAAATASHPDPEIRRIV